MRTGEKWREHVWPRERIFARGQVVSPEPELQFSISLARHLWAHRPWGSVLSKEAVGLSLRSSITSG